jgi:hypothetical protein
MYELYESVVTENEDVNEALNETVFKRTGTNLWYLQADTIIFRVLKSDVSLLYF